MAEGASSVPNNDDVKGDKIDIAVRFLRNPNVNKTDRERKIKFLHSKGLSDDEIEVALQKAEDLLKYEKENADPEAWSLFDYLKGFVLGAGVLATANYAYKAYILPYIAHEMKDDNRIESLAESMETVQDELKQNSYELNSTLKNIQSLLEEHQKILTNLNSQIQRGSFDNSTANDLKTELATLKSMMLSKRQFPPVPFTGGSSEIPAWQKVQEVNSIVNGETDVEKQE